MFFFIFKGKALLLLNEDSFKQRSPRSGDVLHKALQQHRVMLKSLHCQGKIIIKSYFIFNDKFSRFKHFHINYGIILPFHHHHHQHVVIMFHHYQSHHHLHQYLFHLFIQVVQILLVFFHIQLQLQQLLLRLVCIQHLVIYLIVQKQYQKHH